MKIIIDGNWCLHRAYYVFRRFEYDGVKTGTMYGLLRDVFLLAHRFQTNDIHVTWDSKSFRKELNENYKSNRVKEEGDSPYTNWDLVSECLKYAGVNQYIQEGYEGDDIIFSLSQQENDEDVIIFTSDQDMYQCLKQNVKVLRDHKKEPFSLEDFEKELGFPFSIDNYILYKSVVGDGSDNIKGIHRFPKKDIRAYLSGDNMSSRGQKMFDENQDLLEQNKKIFELHNIECTPIKGKINPQGIEKMKSFYGLKQIWKHAGAVQMGIGEPKTIKVKL